MTQKTAKENVSRPRIDEDKFVKVWAKVHNEGGCLQDVAEEIGCTPSGASTKAKILIEAGVPLPKLNRASRSKNRDVKALKDLLRSEMAKK